MPCPLRFVLAGVSAAVAAWLLLSKGHAEPKAGHRGEQQVSPAPVGVFLLACLPASCCKDAGLAGSLNCAEPLLTTLRCRSRPPSPTPAGNGQRWRQAAPVPAATARLLHWSLPLAAATGKQA